MKKYTKTQLKKDQIAAVIDTLEMSLMLKLKMPMVVEWMLQL
jgi:hypothetical protein